MRIGTSAIVVGVSAVLLTGCVTSTYRAEKADLMRDGQSKRVIAAQQDLDNAKAEQLGLMEDQASAGEELAAIEDELASLNGTLANQQRRLVSARQQAKITAAQEASMRQRLNSLQDQVVDKSLELDTARMSGNSVLAAQKRAELQALERELSSVEREIDILIGS
ncbi:MAG: hypothetical protein ACPGOY_09050 [Rhodospirillaceae bacterium]